MVAIGPHQTDMEVTSAIGGKTRDLRPSFGFSHQSNSDLMTWHSSPSIFGKYLGCHHVSYFVKRHVCEVLGFHHIFK